MGFDRPIARRFSFRRILGLAIVLVVGGAFLIPRARIEPPEPEDWRASLHAFQIIPRAEWDAAAPRETGTLAEPHRVTIHHSGEASHSRPGQDIAKRAINGIQHHHQDERGWADIGYHLVIDSGGRLWEGRSLESIGAHAGSTPLNEGNLGVLLLGNFDVAEPTEHQLRTLRSLLERLRKVCGIENDAIWGHHGIRISGGLGGTECPGRYLTRWLVAEFPGCHP